MRCSPLARSWRTLGIGAAALACASARGVPTTNPSATRVATRDDSPIHTDSLVYHLRALPGEYDASAVATYTNRTGAPVHFARCTRESTEPISRLRRSGPDSTIGIAGGIDWACIGGVSTGVVPPGGRLTARVWLGSLESPHAVPPIRPGEGVGRFRIEFRLCAAPEADSDDCKLLPSTARRSNEFEVRF